MCINQRDHSYTFAFEARKYTNGGFYFGTFFIENTKLDETQ